MEKINQLIRNTGLQKVDAIVMKKRFIGMVDHYVLFMGMRNNTPVFVANYSSGVKEVPYNDMVTYLQMLEPTEILYFKGTKYEREEAEIRAKSRIGERAYDYISNNCEHFVNWVHSGKSYSKQVSSAGDLFLAGGAVAALGGLANKNETATYVGLGALLLGALLKYAGNADE